MRRRGAFGAVLVLLAGTAFVVEPPSVLAQGFTVDSGFALIADNAQASARVFSVLKRRFRRLLEFKDLASAQAAAQGQGGPAVALVVAADEKPTKTSAYGTDINACQVVLSARLLNLPSGRLAVALTQRGNAPDCGAALDQAAEKISDDLIRQVEAYRRQGSGEDLIPLRVAFEAPPTPAARDELAARLRTIPGVRRAVAEDDGALRLDLYREAREVAKEIAGLPGVQVRAFAGGEVRLALSGAVADAAAAAPTDRPAAAQTRDLTTPPQPSQPTPVALPPAAAPRLPAGPLRAPAGKWALVVGVSKFKDPEVPELSYADKDAEAFATVLRDPEAGRFAPDHVFLLRNADATVANIKRDLDYIARSSRPDDLVVFFISTHAVPGEIDTAGDSYLVGHDTEKLSLYATGLPMRELVDALTHRVRASQVVAFLDACHTGQVLRRSSEKFTGSKSLAYQAEEPKLQWAQQWKSLQEPPPRPQPRAAQPAPQPVSPGAYQVGGELPAGKAGAGSVPGGAATGEVVAKDVILITSSDGAQRSWESDELRQGFFTYYLMEELRKSGGQAPVSQIFDGMKRKIAESVKREKQAEQEPMIFWNGRAEVVIGAPVSPRPEG